MHLIPLSRPGLVVATATVLHLAFGTASALPDADATAANDNLETVTVYARRITPVSRVAATVTIIDATQIAATLAGDARQLVRYEPGVSVRNDPFRFGLDTFAIRGLGGNRVAVEIDGIPATGGFAVGSYADSGRAFVDTAFIDRVELLRGPASSLYGSDAIGGIVAYTTLSPARLLRNSPAHPVLDGEVGYDGADSASHAAITAAGTAGNAGRWLAGYAHRDGNELATAAGVSPDARDYTADSLMLKYETPELAGAPVLVTFEGGRVEQQTDITAFLGLPGRFVNTTLLQGDDLSERRGASVGQMLGGTNAWFDTADWKLYWQSTGTRQDTLEMRKAVPPRTPAVQLDRGFTWDEEAYGFEFTATRDLRAGSYAHDVVYGTEIARSRLEELRTGLQTTVATGATTPTILGETFPLRDLPLTDITEIGIFVQDEIGRDAGRWSLVPALRIDYYDLSPEVDRIYREDNPATQPVGVDELSLAPKLGITYRITGAATAFFQYSHGFRSPPPEDVNIGLEIPLFNVRAIPNPDLQPEQSDGLELGLRLAGSALQLTGSVYHNEYSDFIESKVNLGVDAATGVTLFQSQNVAHARIYGAELSATVDGAGLRPSLDGWTARLAAAWARGDDLERDKPLNSVEPPNLVFGLHYQPAPARWSAELVTTAVAAQRDVDRSRAELYRTDGYITLDLLADMQLTPRMRLNIGLFNLTDASYIVWADVRGRVVGDPLLPYYTRPGFNAAATLHYSF